MPTTTDFWTEVHQERQCLLDLLEVLTPEQWDVPSLCTQWRVRDVVGHMVSETHMTVAQAGWGLIRSGFRINRYIAKDAQQRGAAPVAKLLEDFRAAVLCRTHLPGLSSLSMLEDIVIHQMDIRRPLEQQRCIPKGRIIAVAGDLWTNRFFSGPQLFQGIRATATDADWSAGSGLEVTGPVEALVLTLAGRFATLDQLQGDGMATLLRAQMLYEGSGGLLAEGRLVSQEESAPSREHRKSPRYCRFPNGTAVTELTKRATDLKRSETSVIDAAAWRVAGPPSPPPLTRRPSRGAGN